MENTLNKLRYFTIKEGANEGQKFTLWDGCILGRALECDIIIADRRASRNHVKVEFRGDDTFLIDLKSANKTFVNGVIISERKLEEGDIVRIAGFAYIFSESKPEDPGADLDSHVLMVSEKAAMTRFQEARSLKDIDSIEGLVKLAKDPSFDRIITILMNLFQVTKKLNTIYDLNKLLDEVLNIIFRTLPNAERGFIMFPDDRSGNMVERIVKTREPGDKIRASRTVIERAMERKEAILSQNVLEDEDLSSGKSIIAEGIRSVLCVPMMRTTQGIDEMLGIIYLDSKSTSTPFSKIDLNILSAIAGQAAVAIKNTQLLEEVKRNAQLRASLQRYLSPDVVEQVIEKKLDMGMGADIKTGAVMFSDLTGFTTICEKLDPDTLISMLNNYFNRMIEIIFANFGTVDKFGGDSVLAVWGAPKATEEADFLALKTSIEMSNALFKINCTEKWKYFLKIGIGIASGRFLAGNVGSNQRMEYTVIGNTVNLAQRIESMAPSDGILINAANQERINRKLASVVFEPITVKGLTQSVKVYAVRGYMDNAAPLRTVLSIPGTMVTDKNKEMRCRIVGFFRDRFNREFISVLHEYSLELAQSVKITPNIPELPTFGSIAAYLCEHDTNIHRAGGKFQGTTLRIEKKGTDNSLLQYMYCEKEFTTFIDLATLKENEKSNM